MFSPYRNDNTGKSITLMIIGSEGTGKHLIGKKITDMGKSINLKCHTCTNLPVPEDSSVYKTGVQFICFMVHLINKESMNRLLETISKVDIAYFLGRALIIANTKGCSTEEEVPQATLMGLSSQYEVPVLFCNAEVDEETTDACRKLIRKIQTCTGQRSNISPLLIESVGVSISTDDKQQTTPSVSVT